MSLCIVPPWEEELGLEALLQQERAQADEGRERRQEDGPEAILPESRIAR